MSRVYHQCHCHDSFMFKRQGLNILIKNTIPDNLHYYLSSLQSWFLIQVNRYLFTYSLNAGNKSNEKKWLVVTSYYFHTQSFSTAMECTSTHFTDWHLNDLVDVKVPTKPFLQYEKHHQSFWMFSTISSIVNIMSWVYEKVWPATMAKFKALQKTVALKNAFFCWLCLL